MGVGLVISPTPYLSPSFNRNNKSPAVRCADTVTHAKRAEDIVIVSSCVIGSAVKSL